MSLLLDDTLTQYVQQDAPPINDYGFSVCLLARLQAAGSVARTLWCLTDKDNASHYLSIRMTSGEIPNIVARAGGSENVIGGAQVMVANNGYSYINASFNSSTSRRIITATSGGPTEQVSGSTSRAPTGMDTICIGALSSGGTISEPWNGDIAEYFLVSGQVTFNDTAAVTNFTEQAVHRYLMKFYSLFWHDRWRRTIIDYRSFRTGLNGGYGEDVVIGPQYKNTLGTPGGPFTAPNGYTIGRHPAAIQGRSNPMNMRRLLVA